MVVTTQASLIGHRFQFIVPDPTNPSGGSRASGVAVYLAFVPQFQDGDQEQFETWLRGS